MEFVVVPKFVVTVHGQPERPVLVIEMGEEPSAVNAVQETPEEHVTEVVAVEARVVKPETFEMYASCEMAMSEVVATAFKPLVEIVTFPVAPETLMPEPAMFERTPALLNALPV